MDKEFQEQLEEAKPYLDAGQPFWCDFFLRPKDSEFCEFLRDNGYDVYYLYFYEFSEGVYSPLNFDPDVLKEIAQHRFEKANSAAK